MRKPGDRNVRPRDAATLIIVRRDGPAPAPADGTPQRRPRLVMPGKWVFPGGRIDRADFRAPYATDLRPGVLARLSKTGPVRRMRALALSAVRETFEEVGLLLGKPAPVRPCCPAPGASSSAWAPSRTPAALDFIARAVTPPYRPKRFDARFFMARGRPADQPGARPRLRRTGRDRLGRPLAEAKTLDLPNITRFVVGELAKRLDRSPSRPAPYVRFLNGKRKQGHHCDDPLRLKARSPGPRARNAASLVLVRRLP